LNHYRVIEADDCEPGVYRLESRQPLGAWKVLKYDNRRGPLERRAIRKRVLAAATVVAMQLSAGLGLTILHERMEWTFDRLFLLAPLPLLVWAWVIENQLYGMELSLGQAWGLLWGRVPGLEEEPPAEVCESDCSCDVMLTVSSEDLPEGWTARGDGTYEVAVDPALLEQSGTVQDEPIDGGLNPVPPTETGLTRYMEFNGAADDVAILPRPEEITVFQSFVGDQALTHRIRPQLAQRWVAPLSTHGGEPYWLIVNAVSGGARTVAEIVDRHTQRLTQQLGRNLTPWERQNLCYVCCGDLMSLISFGGDYGHFRLQCDRCDRVAYLQRPAGAAEGYVPGCVPGYVEGYVGAFRQFFQERRRRLPTPLELRELYYTCCFHAAMRPSDVVTLSAAADESQYILYCDCCHVMRQKTLRAGQALDPVDESSNPPSVQEVQRDRSLARNRLADQFRQILSLDPTEDVLSQLTRTCPCGDGYMSLTGVRSWSTSQAQGLEDYVLECPACRHTTEVTYPWVDSVLTDSPALATLANQLTAMLGRELPSLPTQSVARFARRCCGELLQATGVEIVIDDFVNVSLACGRCGNACRVSVRFAELFGMPKPKPKPKPIIANPVYLERPTRRLPRPSSSSSEDSP
jgi:hypothetical protein